jgi:hypothetical protein
MNRTPSKPGAAQRMTGWLSLMPVMAVAGRETARELNLFLAIIFWMLVVQSAAGFFPTLYVWTWPTALCVAG